MAQEDAFKKLIAHAKEYGFIFPSSEIYDGLSAVYDYGQNGVAVGPAPLYGRGEHRRY